MYTKYNLQKLVELIYFICLHFKIIINEKGGKLKPDKSYKQKDPIEMIIIDLIRII